MVSTRGLKFKFSEGEKVLCYEPDPTKAKVLYDSKVLEVKVNKDQRGRKGVEFLIHFQGWNSSWDRCVTEDYILKDTEENRQLQKDLAHKAQLQLRGAYLYRRDRTKRRRKPGERGSDGPERQKVRRRTSTSVSTTSTSNTSESNLGGSDHDDSASSHDEDESQWNENTSDNSLCADGKEEEDRDDESEHREEKVVLELSAMLRKALERDSHLITKQNKLAKLPAAPDVVTILEEFVKHYATTQLTATAAGTRNGHSHRYSYKYLQHHNKGRDLAGICRNLNICKEVADGLRIYFDFTLKPLLLYEQEKAQAQLANSICPLTANMKIEIGSNTLLDIKTEDFDVTVKQECDDDHEKCRSGASKHPSTHDDSMNADREAARRRSLRSHRPADALATSTTNGVTLGGAVPDSLPGNPQSQMSSVTSTSSRCSTISPAPVGPSIAGGGVGDRGGERPGEQPNDNILGSPRSKAILSQVSSWHLVPTDLYEQVPAPPSLIYGALHLLRLFVRLPDLLGASGIPNRKLKILQAHLENFLGFLEDHPDWFGDEHYEDGDGVGS